MTSKVVTQIIDAGNGKIFRITINRPEVHNCIDGEAAALLLKAWQEFKQNDELTVAVLHSNGTESFCSGADLKALQSLVNISANDKEEEGYVSTNEGPMGGTRIVQTKPVITVSQGYTYAGGLELFCHGHIRIAEESATFSVSCRRWGVPLVDGGTVYLPRLIGKAAALPLIITGQKIDAKRAYDIGLVWEVTEKGKGLERAMEYARQICSYPHDAMFADLASAVNGAHLSIEEALKLEAREMYKVIKSESMRQGVSNFLNGNREWFK